MNPMQVECPYCAEHKLVRLAHLHLEKSLPDGIKRRVWHCDECNRQFMTVVEDK